MGSNCFRILMPLCFHKKINTVKLSDKEERFDEELFTDYQTFYVYHITELSLEGVLGVL